MAENWLKSLRVELEYATANLNEAQWQKAPHGKWNCAEIIEHLGRTYGTTAKMLELHMEAGDTPQVRPGKFAEVLKRWLVVGLGYFPGGQQTPLHVLPRGLAGPQALASALTNLARMDEAIDEAERHWGKTRPIAMHPILGPLNAGQWRKFHYLHGKHHLRQIKHRLAGR